MSKIINRRSFIKTSAVAGASMAVGATSLASQETKEKIEKKSRVVEVYSRGCVNTRRKQNEPLIQKMVEEGILKLTGKKDLAAAWSCFVKPDDVVGVKLNGSFGKYISSKKCIMETVIKGCLSAGVPEQNIIVWDQIKTYLHKLFVQRHKIDLKATKVRFEGCAPALTRANYEKGEPLEGFNTEPIEFPWGKVKVADLVAKKLTAIINLPVLKDHAASGVTLALKNISHAVVDQPWLCHGNSCDPHIADIVNIPVIRKKLRLHILDGLFGVVDGGPPLQNLNQLFINKRILLSQDPVAVDHIGHQWIAEKRKEKGYPPLEEAEVRADLGGGKGRPAKHIATAAKRGLGVNDPKKMEHIKIEVEESEE